MSACLLDLLVLLLPALQVHVAMLLATWTNIFSTTIPFACDDPPNGLHFHIVPEFALENFLEFHLCSRR